jgi:N-acetylneuraminic acid mutarotase/tetrahydromethanopterin S-methyltransferase subunit B
MKKTAIISIGLFCLMTLSLLAPVASAGYPTTWSMSAPLGGIRTQAVVVQAANGTVYVMGGADVFAAYDAVDLANSYNPSTGAWKTLAPLPNPTRGGVGAVGNDGKVYVIAGYDDAGGSAITDTQIYDPATNSWTTGTSIPTEVWEAQGAGDGYFIYVVGGESNGNSYEDLVQIYDIAGDSWSAGALMPVATNAGGLVVSDGYAYLIGGEDSVGATDAVYRYDIAGNSWDSMAAMPKAACAQGVTLGPDGFIYAFGGTDSASNHPSVAFSLCAYYDIKSDTTGVVNNLNVPRAWVGATVYQNKILAIGGNNVTATLSSVESLDTSVTITSLKQEVATLKQQLADANANLVSLTNVTSSQQSQIDHLEDMIANLTASLDQTEEALNNAIDAADNKAGEARTAADSANMIGMIGIIIGIVAIVIAVIALVMKKKTTIQQMQPMPPMPPQ